MDCFELRNPFKLSREERRRLLRLGLRDGFVPSLIQFGILLLAILEFTFLIGKRNGAPRVQPSRSVRGEESDPNLARLIYLFVSLIASVLLAAQAEKRGREGADAAAFWCGAVGGTLLWQSVGECAWHFAVGSGEGALGLPRIDHAEGTPLFAAALALMALAAKRRSFGFGTWVFFLNFMLIWLGHFSSYATYPAAAGRVSEPEWIRTVGLALGVPLSAAALYLMFVAAKDKKGRLLSSLLLYSSLSLLLQGRGMYRKH